MSRPTVLLAARLMPEGALGGQERLSAAVHQALAARFPVKDLANHGPKWRQWDYLTTIEGRLRREGRRHERPVVDASDGSLALPVARSGLPSVMRANGKDVLWTNPVYRAVCQRAFPRIHAVVANSGETARNAILRGARAETVHVVHPPAVAPSDWVQTPEAGRVLIAARLMPVKGVVEFVRDVWPMVAAANPAARLDIAGDGPERARLERALEGLACAASVRLHGMLGSAALDELYRKASVLAMTSRPMKWGSEGFGMVCVEAALRGVPTVAYAVGGVPEAVVPGKTGWLLATMDAQVAAETLIRVLAGTLAVDREAMRVLAEERWGIARFAREYCAVHEAVAERAYG